MRVQPTDQVRPAGAHPRADSPVSEFITAGVARIAGDQMVMGLKTSECAPWDGAGKLVAELSPRELEVFVLLGMGLGNRRIGQVLGVTERTAKTHVGRVIGKLGLESRLQVGLAALVYLAGTGYHGLAAS
jgi:DNA-binding NarL/FixJ family response regulator